LAKRLGANVSVTLPKDAWGTPPYMAPEQLSLPSDEHTKAVDTYALGVILYQLLTGEAPFEGSKTGEIETKILNDDPPSPRIKNPLVDRDLEIICLKCLEKDPERRYRSAEALADDLQRWLLDEPIYGRPPSAVYRLRKFLVRKKAVVVPVAAALVMAVWFVTWTLQRKRAEDSRIATLTEQKRAEQEAKKELAALWTRVVLAKQGIYKNFLNPGKVRKELDVAIGELDKFVQDHKADHEAYYVRAYAKYYRRDLKGAKEDLKQAFALAKSNFTPGRALEARILLEEHQLSLYGFGDPAERERKAAPLLEEALGRVRSGDLTLFRTGEDDVMSTLMKVLTMYFLEKKRKDAFNELERANRENESEEYWCWIGAWAQEDQKERCFGRAIEVAPNFYRGYLDRGNVRLKRRDKKGAEEDLGKVLEIDPENKIAHSNLGRLYILNGSFDDAIDHCKKALMVDDGYFPALVNCGTAYYEKSLRSEAERNDCLKEAENWFQRAIRNSPGTALVWRNLAAVKADQKEFEEAIRAAKKACEIDPNGSSRILAGVYYNWACECASKAKTAPADERERLLGQAMEKLGQSKSHGFFEQPGMKEHTTKDAALELLRPREEFKKLINDPRP